MRIRFLLNLTFLMSTIIFMFACGQDVTLSPAKDDITFANDAVAQEIVTGEEFKSKLGSTKESDSFILGQDITLEDLETIPSFKGKLNGNNKTIIIKSFVRGSSALFKVIEESSEIKDLKIRLENDITLSGGSTGVLAGENKAKLTNIRLYNPKKKLVTNTDSNSVSGGLIGHNKGKGVSKLYSEVNIEGGQMIGGLIGLNEGVVILGHSTGDVHTINSGDTYAGGLIGYNKGPVHNSVATGDAKVTSTKGSAYAGGLIGKNTSPIFRSHTIGDANVTAHGQIAYVGGLIGENVESANVEESSAMGIAIGTSTKGAAYAGGLIGNSPKGLLRDTAATGTVIAKSHTVEAYAGGLVGFTWDSTVKDSNSISNVKAEGIDGVGYAGGLLGHTWNSKITNSYALGKVSASSKTKEAISGGLIGINEGGEKYSFVNNLVVYTGLVGDVQDAKVEHSYSKSVVSAISEEGYAIAGGLIGVSYSKVEYSHATGNVKAEGGIDVYAGGLIGINNEEVKYSYSRSKVTTTISKNAHAIAGGFIGFNRNKVQYSYSTAKTLKATGKRTELGRFIGHNVNTIINCFVEKLNDPGKNVGNSSSTNDVADGVSAIYESQITQNTFTGWDHSIWDLTGATAWPLLRE